MRTVIAHGHIFKNAGTTLDYALKKNFGDGFCDHRDDKPMLLYGAAYLQQYLEDNQHIEAISSHHLCDVSKINDIKIIPIYILRHPIERVLSVYNFEKNQDAKTPGAIAAKKYNFKDYVQWRMKPDVNPTIRNYQTIYLAGQQAREPIIPVNHNDFNSALCNANKSLVGIVEEFDNSMLLFEKELSKNGVEVDLSYVKQNVSNDNQQSLGENIATISNELGEVMGELINKNSFDLNLYHTKSDSLKIYFGARSEQEVNDFKNRCDKLI